MQQIKHVKDLISLDNMIYSFTQFTVKYGDCISWLNYYSLITTIPITWLEMLFITPATPENAFLFGYNQLYQFQSISKIAYDRQALITIRSCTTSTKLRDFQYRGDGWLSGLRHLTTKHEV